MKQLFTSLLLLVVLNSTAQNVGVGTATPICKLDVFSSDVFVSRFNGPSGMYIAFTENNVYRGYVGSYSGAAEDMDFGTGTGNTTGKVHLTLQGVPKLTVEATGAVNIQDELTRSSKTGSSNLLPICYGNVNAAGFVQTGSGNFTVSRFTTGFYQITITDENYHFQQYVTVVTAIGSTVPVIATTGSGGGQLQVYLYNISGASVDGNFHFVVYKQ